VFLVQEQGKNHLTKFASFGVLYLQAARIFRMLEYIMQIK